MARRETSQILLHCFTIAGSGGRKHEAETPGAAEAVGPEAAFIEGEDLVEAGLVGEQDERGIGEVHRGVAVFLHESRSGLQLGRGETISDVNVGVVEKSGQSFGSFWQPTQKVHRFGHDRSRGYERA